MMSAAIRRVPLVLSTEEDADLVAWIESLEKGQRSYQIRRVLRAYLQDKEAGKPIDADELRRILKEAWVRASVGEEGSGEDSQEKSVL